MMTDPDRLVAHRGWPSRNPENSLAGFDAAIAAGARNIEFDVQLSRDLVPVVLHDGTTERIGGDPRNVFDLDASDVVQIANGEPQRFGNQFESSRIVTLATVVEHYAAFDGRFFIELKRQSIAKFGVEQCLEALTPPMRKLGSRGVLISFDDNVVELARNSGIDATGWVIKGWTSSILRRASAMRPDYLFIKRRRLRSVPDPFPGPYTWVVYDVDNRKQATKQFERGAGLIETDFIGEFLWGQGIDEI